MLYHVLSVNAKLPHMFDIGHHHRVYPRQGPGDGKSVAMFVSCKPTFQDVSSILRGEHFEQVK